MFFVEVTIKKPRYIHCKLTLIEPPGDIFFLLPVLYLHLVVSKILNGCAILNLTSTLPVKVRSRYSIFEKVAIIPSHTGSQPKNIF